MKEISRIFYKIIFLFLLTSSVEVNGKILSEGNADAKVTVKVFSSLTCPACANFHSEIYYELKKEFIDVGLVKFEHHPFPLDLAALNAEVILRCSIKGEKKFELLGKIYKKQNLWAVGSDINKINESIKKIGSEFDMNDEKMNNCLKNDKSQDEILNQRIEAQKKYNIQSTPTIYINEKKYSGKVDYKQFKKAIEKNL
tara:strand:- start:315 stop:908 length:594 start_codon:yes stop_codon:yes gene_type:complete